MKKGNEEKIEHLTQIIDDLYINWKIKTLDNYMKKNEKIVTDIIYNKKREKK